MEILRTPDARFNNLPDYAFAPHYVHVDGLRIHYVDEGPADAPPVLMLHGEPSWSYLYRKLIPIITAAGYRAVAPDLVGFGRSDKPARRSTYTYASHVAWLSSVLNALDLRQITLVAQEWGGLLGLRLATAYQERFARIVVANTALPTGDQPLGLPFRLWQLFSQLTPRLPIGGIVRMGCVKRLSPAVVSAYKAPFPNERYKAGARQFPLLVPSSPNDPAAPANRQAWEVLQRWEKPFLTAFSDSDPITRGAERVFQARIPGARGQPHTTIRHGGHFLQEDQGEQLARVVVDFIGRTEMPASVSLPAFPAP